MCIKCIRSPSALNIQTHERFGIRVAQVEAPIGEGEADAIRFVD